VSLCLQRIRTMEAVTRFLAATVCFFGFGLPLLTIFKSFRPFSSFFYFENKTLRCNHAVSQMLAKEKSCGRALPRLGVCLPPSALHLLEETFHILLKVHLHEIFATVFFFSNSILLVP
jgi:hypothetical protein